MNIMSSAVFEKKGGLSKIWIAVYLSRFYINSRIVRIFFSKNEGEMKKLILISCVMLVATISINAQNQSAKSSAEERRRPYRPGRQT